MTIQKNSVSKMYGCENLITIEANQRRPKLVEISSHQAIDIHCCKDNLHFKSIARYSCIGSTKQ